MLLLGLVLLAATGAFTGLLIAYNQSGPDYTIGMFGNTLGTLNSLEIFISGIVLALLFCLGLLMVMGSAAYRRRRRLARRAERREAQEVLARRDAWAAGSGGTDAPVAETDERGTTAMPPRRRHRHIFGH